jgi:beta-glucosidase
MGDGRFSVTFDVANTGDRAGATVAQLYVGEASPTLARPAKELKEFERVMLQPGESAHVKVELGPRSFSFYDITAASWRANAGSYNLMLGDSSANLQQKITLELPKPIITPVSD